MDAYDEPDLQSQFAEIDAAAEEDIKRIKRAAWKRQQKYLKDREARIRQLSKDRTPQLLEAFLASNRPESVDKTLSEPEAEEVKPSFLQNLFSFLRRCK